MNVHNWRSTGFGLAATLALAILPVLVQAQAPDESHKPGTQVRDAEGRGAYIIDLKREAANQYPAIRRDSGRFADYHRGNVVNLVEDIEWTHQVHAIAMTSWSSTSFTAYLTSDQVAEIKKDPRVVGVEPDTYMTFSADPDTTAVWNDSATTSAAPPGSLWSNRLTSLTTEIRPWGQAAVNNTSTSSNGRSIVYIVDSGVGQHEDLNVVEWVNGVNPANALCDPSGLPQCTTAIMPRVVGCYSHSTGVAGIVGAKVNGVGIKGVNPNTKIISVSVLDPTTANTRCLTQPSPIGHNVKSALDWVMQDVASSFSGIPAVVNLSINWGGVADFTGTDISNVKADMAALGAATPGAFVVQSAGNDFDDACAYAYNSPNSNDGVMVVGAINNHGQPVVPLNGARGFWREWTEFGHELGSNWNPAAGTKCVDTWAPGDVVLVPVGDVFAANNGNTVYHSYAYGGGTSFAAPHVAGLAAYLVDTTAVTSARQVEQQVRAKLFSLGSKAPTTSAAVGMHLANGSAITIPSQTPLGSGVPHQTPYAELYVMTRCWYAPFATSVPPGCTPNFSDIAQNQRVGPPITDPDPLAGAQRNRGTLSGASTSIWATFDSYGLPPYSCDVKFATPPLGGPVLDTATTYHNYGSVVDAGNARLYSSVCPSAQVSITY